MQGDPTAWAVRSSVPMVVGNVDCVSRLGQARGDVCIASAVLSVAVGDHDHGVDGLLRQPGPEQDPSGTGSEE